MKFNNDYRATGTNVLVKMDENDVDGHEAGHDVRTQGGVSLVNSDRSKSQRGTVVAVGPGKVVEGELMAVFAKVGEKVILERFGTDIVLEGERYRNVDDREILAVIEDDTCFTPSQ